MSDSNDVSGVIQAIQSCASTFAALNTSNSVKLGVAAITTPFTTTTTSAYVDVTGLSVAVTVPAGGRDVKITAFCPGMKNSATAGTVLTLAIREGSTVLNQCILNEPVAAYNLPMTAIARVASPTAGSHTYYVSVAKDQAGTLTCGAGTSATVSDYGAAFILVELL